MISVVCCFWDRRRRSYQTFSHHTVNVLRRMVSRNLKTPHEFVCMTDQPAGGFDPEIRLMSLATDLIPLGNAYPKLAVFKRDPGLRDWSLFLDLDTVITGPLDPLIDPAIKLGLPAIFLPEFCVAGRRRGMQAYYNTSIFILRTGSLPQVWDKFDPKTSPQFVRRTRKIGSDQVWISETLGPDQATWSADERIVSFKYHCAPDWRSSVRGSLADGVSVVCFHGAFKPWDSAVQEANPWIVEHWR